MILGFTHFPPSISPLVTLILIHSKVWEKTRKSKIIFISVPKPKFRVQFGRQLQVETIEGWKCQICFGHDALNHAEIAPVFWFHRGIVDVEIVHWISKYSEIKINRSTQHL